MCLSCLHKQFTLSGGTTLPCPLDRRLTQIPSAAMGGVSALANDFRAMDLGMSCALLLPPNDRSTRTPRVFGVWCVRLKGEWLELSRGGATKSNCSECDDSAAVHCEHCNRLYCSDHERAHRKSHLTKHHTLIAMDTFLKIPPKSLLAVTSGGTSSAATAPVTGSTIDVKHSIPHNAAAAAAILANSVSVTGAASSAFASSPTTLRLSDCPLHPGYPLDIYCVTHDQPICVRCSALSHKKCDGCEDIKDSFGKQKSIIMNLLNKVESRAVGLNASQKQLMNVASAVKSQHEIIEQKINGSYLRPPLRSVFLTHIVLCYLPLS